MVEVVTIDFVKSAETTSDIMTKNQQGAYFKSAQPKLVYTVKDMEQSEKKVQLQINKGCSILSYMFNNLEQEVAQD